MINAPAVARYMSELSHSTSRNGNYELANVLCRISDELESVGLPFGKKWKDFSEFERKFILSCKNDMETMYNNRKV
tara:strand:+ start:351 stop:578 length:228 start_codon:yes stop_codon:yes gene_type:complete